MVRIKGYGRRDATEPPVRIALVMPQDEIDRLDAWGIAAEMPSRTAAIRLLVKKDPEAIEALNEQRAPAWHIQTLSVDRAAPSVCHTLVGR